MIRVEIIAVGREILTGRTLDTNSHWIAGRITALGGVLGRIVSVDDNLDDISAEIASSVARGADVVITTGGLGPTADDMTLEGMARGLGRGLSLDAAALEFVRKRYELFFEQGYVDSKEMTPSRRKMAVIPEGGEWLSNGVGAAPGIKLEAQGTVFFALPGVPEEMRSIFEESVEPFLRKLFSGIVRLEESMATGIGDESILTPILKRVMKRLKGVYLKPDPKGFGTGVDIGVYISVRADDKGKARARMNCARRMLLSELESARRGSR